MFKGSLWTLNSDKLKPISFLYENNVLLIDDTTDQHLTDN